MILTYSEQIFWKAVFEATTRAGHGAIHAVQTADSAIMSLRDRLAP